MVVRFGSSFAWRWCFISAEVAILMVQRAAILFLRQGVGVLLVLQNRVCLCGNDFLLLRQWELLCLWRMSVLLVRKVVAMRLKRGGGKGIVIGQFCVNFTTLLSNRRGKSSFWR